MFERLARLTTARPRLILFLALLFAAGAVVLGGGVADRLQGGGTTDPAAESSQAARLLDREFAAGRPNLALLVKADAGVDDPAVAAEAERLTERLAAEHDVQGVTSYWQAKSPALRSENGRYGLVVARVTGTETEADDTLKALAPHYRGSHGPVDVSIGGAAQIRAEVQDTSREDLARAEVIALPLTLLILVLVFRSAVAALLPVIIGLIAIVGTNASLRVITGFTDVSVFALNLTTALGLGLAVDYGLFIVRRYREELHGGAPPQTAVRTTLATAGRTVAFSALTVAVALSAMLLFPMYYLRSFAYAGISVVLIAAAAALVVLPALLLVLGKRIDALDLTRIFRRRPAAGGTAPDASGRRWRRIGEAVVKRPVVFAVTAVAFLVALGAPFLGVTFGNIDDRQLPKDAEAHQVHQVIRDGFTSRPTGELDVVAQGVDGKSRTTDIASYATTLSRLDGVVRVNSSAGTYAEGRLVQQPGPAHTRYTTTGASYLAVEPSLEDVSPESQDLVRAIRDVPSPFPVLVGGGAAELVDTQDTLADRLPYALLAMVGVTMILLFLMTGSVVVPLKAVVLNTLSLSATFGALVWVFQDGHLSGLLGDFTVTGFIPATLPVLMFCVAFGLSMDYEVFVLSRIKEEYDRTGDTTRAIVFGLQRSGGVVTAAAAVLSVVLVAIGTSQITNMKMLGLGLALAVLMDAIVVRGVLVPSVMRLLGRANWWAPGPLRRLHGRFGISEGGPPAAPVAVPRTHRTEEPV
ncbi:MMPL family transporter [Streptomyces justiciae]|uniref:MMPL family transporter n=1 Tax=Streptomyces justiciae TaxID=2780140 RepID=UPI002118B8AC|nr:MMPL family transporter [Streptomyces justiciae]MCW8375462.1 MMPL family transporter [Streptomyces justiciae]